ncbi:DUF1015 domain-containing protein [Lujinxingia litoralis]|uniref:DUF1015 domain-containing protein n=1 Tax=Lujinxingia litoralis TaxID=2211119 RepID=A0A328CCM9_9DELT|nr:DUF1015 domain-containing protein [Lujinxingia litoralis]RAL23937.1 DUF1015 domain-containing protein [Lujinxingia litoralis]
MAEVKAFRGVRYSWESMHGEEASQVVAPPYDVIDEAMLEELYQRHPQNVVRLDLNRRQASDSPENNRYTRARRYMFDWLAQGVMIVEPEPAIYVHVQEFEDEAGQVYRRQGFMALVRLADYEERVVLPHERTLKGPKADRLELMKATDANLSQIFFLYDDEEGDVDRPLYGAIEGEAAALDIRTEDGIRHQLWAVRDEAVQQAVQAGLKERPLLIADGHHRYETALAYREFRRQVAEEPDGDAPYEYVMGFLVNMHDPGLQVFPTHRVVHSVAGFDGEKLRAQLEEAGVYRVEELSRGLLDDLDALRERLEAAGGEYPSFVVGMVGGSLLLVQYVGGVDSPVFDEETPEEVRRLDVAVLHEAIFDRMLGIDRAAQEAKSNLGYVKGWAEARAALDEPGHQMVVFMNATPVEQVNRVCLSGGKMPQKSTFFYPKVLSGLVINLL